MLNDYSASEEEDDNLHSVATIRDKEETTFHHVFQSALCSNDMPAVSAMSTTVPNSVMPSDASRALQNYGSSEESENGEEGNKGSETGNGTTKVVRGRKHSRDNLKWQKSQRKRVRQAGDNYINSKGNVVPERKVNLKKDCNKCKLKCRNSISLENCHLIHKEFWCLSDDEKLNFYDKKTHRIEKKRVRAENKNSK